MLIPILKLEEEQKTPDTRQPPPPSRQNEVTDPPLCVSPITSLDTDQAGVFCLEIVTKKLFLSSLLSAGGHISPVHLFQWPDWTIGSQSFLECFERESAKAAQRIFK